MGEEKEILGIQKRKIYFPTVELVWMML